MKDFRTLLYFSLFLFFLPNQNALTVLQILSQDVRFTILTSALVQFPALTQLLSVRDNLTIFAPDDQSFQKLPIIPSGRELLALLSYHISGGSYSTNSLMNGMLLDSLLTLGELSGEPQKTKVTVIAAHPRNDIYINKAKLLLVDVVASNGVVQGVNSVLAPPKDIGAQISEDVQFSILTQCLQYANLTLQLSQPDLTRLAPSDYAWKKLPFTTLDFLLSPAGKHELVNIIKYHILPGLEYRSTIPLGTSTVATMEGRIVIASNSGGSVVFNGESAITDYDILASNGVFHIIDTVLLPK